MKKLFLVALLIPLILCSCAMNTDLTSELTRLQTEVDELKEANANLESEKTSLEADVAELDRIMKEVDQIEKEVDALEKEHTSLQEEYAAYKEKMSEYEDLSEKEAEARKIEAEKAIAEAKAEEERKAEEARKEAEEQKRKEEELAKKGYDTGITFDQLARTPDDYKGQKVKFKGTVVQVLEGDGEIDLRIAINGDYDKIVLAYYPPSLLKSRVLEDDKITIYGIFQGLYTYDSVMGGKITVPLIKVDKIDQ